MGFLHLINLNMKANLDNMAIHPKILARTSQTPKIKNNLEDLK